MIKCSCAAKKMEALREEGIDPFGKRFDRTHNSAELHEQYDNHTKEELSEMNTEVSVARTYDDKNVVKEKLVSPICKTVKAKFKFMFGRTKLETKPMNYLNMLT